jgi:DNA damage-binding protein 1
LPSLALPPYIADIPGYSHALLSPSHLLLGDLYGKLLLVTLSLFSPSPSISIQDLGDATSATSIVSLARGLVYLSSRFGDSQVVRLPAGLVPAAEGEMEVEGETGGAGGLELVESFTGLAPIVDAVVLGGEGEDGGSGVRPFLLFSLLPC